MTLRLINLQILASLGFVKCWPLQKILKKELTFLIRVLLWFGGSRRLGFFLFLFLIFVRLGGFVSARRPALRGGIGASGYDAGRVSLRICHFFKK